MVTLLKQTTKTLTKIGTFESVEKAKEKYQEIKKEGETICYVNVVIGKTYQELREFDYIIINVLDEYFI